MGSRHIREVLEDVVGHVERVVEVPPGVDVDAFVLQERDRALLRLVEEARDDPPNPGNAEERLPDEGNADRLAEFLLGGDPTVVYFGKLIEPRRVRGVTAVMVPEPRASGPGTSGSPAAAVRPGDAVSSAAVVELLRSLERMEADLAEMRAEVERMRRHLVAKAAVPVERPPH